MFFLVSESERQFFSHERWVSGSGNFCQWAMSERRSYFSWASNALLWRYRGGQTDRQKTHFSIRMWRSVASFGVFVLYLALFVVLDKKAHCEFHALSLIISLDSGQIVCWPSLTSYFFNGMMTPFAKNRSYLACDALGTDDQTCCLETTDSSLNPLWVKVITRFYHNLHPTQKNALLSKCWTFMVNTLKILRKMNKSRSILRVLLNSSSCANLTATLLFAQ